MANPAESEVQNLLPVQAYFNVDGSFNTFIGQGQPFYATANPQQSGLQITNSTINSSVIGGITPAAGNFSTATVLTQPVSATDVVNLLTLQSYVTGISWKQPCVAATLANITLSGLQTIDGKAVIAGDRVLVKDQSTAANNGIYIVSASAWTRSSDADTWDELICAITFIEYGTQAGGAWFCTAQDGGTLGVTAVNWSQFTTSATYSAGTGLTLTGQVFSITPVGTASTYGSASSVPVFTTNASGQVSSVTNTSIAIGATQITSGTIDSSRLSGSYSGITGLGTLTDLTVTNNIVGSITGNAATATTATNIAGGAAGSVPYQTGAGATGFLAAGTNGQVLTLASGVPSWATPTTGTVTSVSGSGTVSGISLSGTVTSSGSLTLGGTLDLSAPPAIGGTTANTVRGTTVTATSNFVGTNFDASGSGGGALRNDVAGACLQWGGGGGVNVTVNGPINMNGANSAIQINPTGTGTVSIAPAGALTVNPTTASTMNNVAIGGTTPLAGTFTDLRFNGTLSLAGTTGTAGFVLTSNGASAPTWQANANGLAITDDTTTNATRYLAFTSATSGSITGANVSSTKLQYNPSTGAFITANDASISGLTVGKGVGSVSTNTAVGALTIGVTSGTTTGTNNTAFGYATLSTMTTGSNNTGVGWAALNGTTTGTNNTALGVSALQNNTTAGNNTAVGFEALKINTTGSFNVAIGSQVPGVSNAALFSNTTGSNNVAVGNSALALNTTSSNNTAVGYQAGYSNVSSDLGGQHTFVGYQAGYLTTTGTNAAFGSQALYSNTTGDDNTAIGSYRPLYANTTGTDNVAVGRQALSANTTGSFNTALGRSALFSNTTASNNTAVGYQAAYANTTGTDIVAIGWSAAKANTTGLENTAVGAYSLFTSTTASNNTAVGRSALELNTTGATNTAIGHSALKANTTASNNTAVGYLAGFACTTNGANTLIGASCGTTITSGTNNTYLGGGATASGATVAQEIIICAGNGATGKGANTGFISPNAGAVYQGNNSATWSITSDARLKKNIVDNTTGLDAISQIQVRNFEYRTANEVIDLPSQNAIEITGVQLGAIAQELKEILPECVKTESTGVMSVDTTNLTWYLINAVKELNAKITALENK
jgi:hypothetical protein